MVYIILAILWAVIWGCITKKVNENKGYYGGFWLGFWLGFIGLIIVSCKEDNRPAYNSTTDYIAPLEKSEDSWKCAKCGRYNSGYVCECGLLKGDSALLEKQQAERNKQKSEEKVKSDKEVENLQKLKAYKDLLDSGVISQEEFDKKKTELLNL